jgi:hypothetical protein
MGYKAGSTRQVRNQPSYSETPQGGLGWLFNVLSLPPSALEPDLGQGARRKCKLCRCYCYCTSGVVHVVGDSAREIEARRPPPCNVPRWMGSTPQTTGKQAMYARIPAITDVAAGNDWSFQCSVSRVALATNGIMAMAPSHEEHGCLRLTTRISNCRHF